MDGVGNVVKNYAYWMNKRYGKSYVITPAYPQYVDKEEFEVLRYHSFAVPKRPPYRWGVPRMDLAFMKRIHSIPFDVLHAHCPFTSGQIALHIARKRNIPLVATFHSKYYDDFKEVFKVDHIARYIVKRIVHFYHSVDYVWTVNKGSADTLRSYGFKGEVDIIANGTDFIPPEDRSGARRRTNEKLDLKPEDTVLLFVGQHIWQKNVKLIIESLYQLKKSGISFKMIFAGTGYAEQEMKEMVRQMHLSQEVIFLGMVLDREWLKSLYCRADLFLFPSVYDNAPIVIREAAAAQCPSVVVENTNTAEGIIDGYNGYLSKNDVVSFTEKLKEILSDRKKLVEVGRTAQQTVYKNWEKIIDDVAARYLEIVNIHNRFNKSIKL